MALTDILNLYIMPAALFICGILLAFKIKLLHILSPVRFFRTLKNAVSGDGVSPAKAMCTALAGTFGVGNIAGVATAITAGGAGAVLWMWIGSLVSMSVKYGEVSLAVKYRKRSHDQFIGGSMYTIRDGMSKHLGKKSARELGGIFAVLCILNSFIMGNVIQTGAACSVFSLSPLLISGIFALIIITVSAGGAKLLTSITYALIPVLSTMYIILSMSVICRNMSLVPKILDLILTEGLGFRSAVGGGVGLGITKAIRYGVTRGIFSNEAGCGTSPTAHASADTRSPHHQGCFGIFEVITDTPILCTMTALVILIAEEKNHGVLAVSNGVLLSLRSFEMLLGRAAYYIIGVSVMLFALATVIAQLYYGRIAVGYLTGEKDSRLFPILFATAAAMSSQFSESVIWLTADIIIAVMTLINVWVLFVMRKEVSEISRATY